MGWVGRTRQPLKTTLLKGQGYRKNNYRNAARVIVTDRWGQATGDLFRNTVIK